MSWRITVPCTREQGERIADAEDIFPRSAVQPTVVADEPDESRPNDWVLHAYFDQQPTDEDIVRLRELGSGEPEVEHLEDTIDWVTKSQSGLQPIRAGRFFGSTRSGSGSGSWRTPRRRPLRRRRWWVRRSARWIRPRMVG